MQHRTTEGAIEHIRTLPSNKRLQLTAFGARDRACFDTLLLLDCFVDLLGRQLKRERWARLNPLLPVTPSGQRDGCQQQLWRLPEPCACGREVAGGSVVRWSAGSRTSLGSMLAHAG